jgi:hypothetical protein
MEGHTLNPARCVAFASSLVLLGCLTGLIVMLATMHQCTSLCPTSPDSIKQPDVLVNVVAPHPEQPIPVPTNPDGTTNNVLEVSITSITTSEIYKQEKSPDGKNVASDSKAVIVFDPSPVNSGTTKK